MGLHTLWAAPRALLGLLRSPSPHGMPSGAVSAPSTLAIPAAIHSASSSAVSWKAQTTRPRSIRLPPGTSTGTSLACIRSGICSRAATSRTASPLRKLTESRRTGAGSPAAVLKSRGSG